LRADYKRGMSAIPSIAAISVAASSYRLGAFPHSVAHGTASGAVPTSLAPASSTAGTALVSNTAPASNAPLILNQAGIANSHGLAQANPVNAAGAVVASGVPEPPPSVVVDFDPRSPYGPTNGVPPSVDLASEMIQQLVAYYPFTPNGQVHADTSQTLDIKT
jgi:hypothetical protein